MIDSLKEKCTQKKVWVILTEDEKQGVMVDDFGFLDLTGDLTKVLKCNSEEIAKSKIYFIKKKDKKFVVKECIYTKQEILLPTDTIVGGRE